MIPGEATGHFDPNGIVTGGKVETPEERAWRWRRIQAAARNRETLRRVLDRKTSDRTAAVIVNLIRRKYPADVQSKVARSLLGG